MDLKKIRVGPLKTNCYILKSGPEALIIDPGGEPERILEALGDSRLSLIVLTHYHFDHHLAYPAIKEAHPGAMLLIHEADSAYLPFKADRLLGGKDFVEIGQARLEVLHTPGHSAGSICLASGDDIFSGDTVFAGGLIGRTDLPGSDPRAMEESLLKLRRLITGRITVRPGHGREFQADQDV